MIWCISTSCNCAWACLCWSLYRWHPTPVQLHGLIFLLPICSDFNQKDIFNFESVSLLSCFMYFLPFHCDYARKNLKKINKQITPLKMLCRRLDSFDDFFCDTTQLVNINRTAVNLPFSLFSIYFSHASVSIIGCIQWSSIVIFRFCL